MFLHAAKLQIKILKRWLSSKKLIEIPIEVTTNWTQDSEEKGGGYIFQRTIFKVVLSVSSQFGKTHLTEKMKLLLTIKTMANVFG